VAEIDSTMTDDLICPHCGATQSDPWETVGHEEGGHAWCGECGEKYCWSVHTRLTYSTTKEDD